MPNGRTIDDVIGELDAIVLDAIRNANRIGYFAALYLRVTTNIKRAIVGNFFADGDRMERFDVVFADLFLNAYKTFLSGGEPPLAWKAAFSMLEDPRPLVLQHLLLGINAHVNLDLGVAAATIAPGDALLSLRVDFDRVNEVLSRLICVVEVELGQISPRLKKMESLSADVDDRLFDFTLDTARAEAWRLAQSLALLPPDKWAPVITARDMVVAELGKMIAQPPILSESVVAWIRAAESNDVAYNIQIVGE